MSNSNKFVYFFVSWDSNFVKIGYCQNIKHRMSNIQNGCPYKLHCWIGFKVDNHAKLESAFHDLFKEFHYRGEWFLFTEKAFDVALDIREKLGGRISFSEELESKINGFRHALL